MESLPPIAWLIAGLGVLVAAAVLGVHVLHLRRATPGELALLHELQRDLQAEERRRELLLRLSERALAGGPLDNLWRYVTQVVTEGLRVRKALVLRSDSDTHTLSAVATAGFDDGDLPAFEARPDSQLGYALFVGEPV